MGHVFGAELCRVENREHLGKPALVAVAIRTYVTTVDDLWDAITTPERLARWFRGTITRCERPEALDLTWEFMGATSWVNLRLAPDGQKARLTLEHIAHKDGIGEEHLKQYGPGAVGIGWDLALHGLMQHLANPRVAIDPAAFEAWTLSGEGKAFIRKCGEAWGAAHAASGEDPEEARAKAERTIAFYAGA